MFRVAASVAAISTGSRALHNNACAHVVTREEATFVTFQPAHRKRSILLEYLFLQNCPLSPELPEPEEFHDENSDLTICDLPVARGMQHHGRAW